MRARVAHTPNTNYGQSARNRLVAPGLGSRVAARHPELTYPIRFKMRRLGLQGACDGAFPAIGTASALDRVSQSQPEPCEYNKRRVWMQGGPQDAASCEPD